MMYEKGFWKTHKKESVVVTGCHANLFYADEPKPQLEQLTDAFWDYVAKATSTADDVVQTIRKTPFGEDIK